MTTEIALPATLVAFLISFPYLFSPLQVVIGSFSDRHPVGGRRRTPYILIGLALCAVGLAASPSAAYAFTAGTAAGLLVSVLAFGAWGTGFTFASVSYFSLASELSGEKGRGRTIATMFFFMIVSIILTAFLLSRMLEPYSADALRRSFALVAGVAFVIGCIGVIGLEPRAPGPTSAAARTSWNARWRSLSGNSAAILFFFYLIVMLAPILGESILLPPFGAAAFGMSVKETTGITSIWGTFFLVSLVAAGALEGRMPRRPLIVWSSAAAAASYLLIAASGLGGGSWLFYGAVSALGLATGAATVANLSLMLDMSVAGRVGLFMGAWGMADALARLLGNMSGGILRDLLRRLTGATVPGYIVVFSLLALMLVVSLAILRRVDVKVFQEKARARLHAGEADGGGE